MALGKRDHRSFSSDTGRLKKEGNGSGTNEIKAPATHEYAIRATCPEIRSRKRIATIDRTAKAPEAIAVHAKRLSGCSHSYSSSTFGSMEAHPSQAVATPTHARVRHRSRTCRGIPIPPVSTIHVPRKVR